MATTTSECAYTPALLIGEQSLQLLANAEALIYETECSNHCAHHREGVYSNECPHFVAAADGYVKCDGYIQAGEEVS